MKYPIFIVSIVLFLAAGSTVSVAQTGTVRGTITVKEVSGNNLGGFDCSNISVAARGFGASAWTRWVKAHGDLAKRTCEYSMGGVPAGDAFTVSLSGNFPKGCDLRVFKADSSMPLTVKRRARLIYNATVQRITCTLVK